MLWVTEATFFFNKLKVGYNVDTKTNSISREELSEQLKEISKLECLVKHPYSKLSLKGEELDCIFYFLKYFGVVSTCNDGFTIPSDSAKLFIASLAQYIKLDISLVNVWDNPTKAADTINMSNVLIASNFLYIIENRRKAITSPEQFIPIKENETVRIVLSRKIFGKVYYLMQFDSSVGCYQFVGGIKKDNDIDLERTVSRKLKEELPELDLEDTSYSITQIHESCDDEEEVFLSKKFNVYVRYKTHFFDIKFKNNIITKKMLKNLSKNENNKWVSLREIKKMKANNGKPIFKIYDTALEALERFTPNILVLKYDISFLLKKTWVQAVLSISTILSLLLGIISLL